jgi:hypothetical protein
MIYSLKKLLKEFHLGALNGFILGFSAALITDLFFKLAVIFKIRQFEPSPLAYVDYIGAVMGSLIAAGLSKVITRLLFSNVQNIYVEWQIVGLITNILLYSYILAGNTFEHFTEETIDYRYTFSESLNIIVWLFILLIISAYNLLFASAIKFMKGKNQT